VTRLRAEPPGTGTGFGSIIGIEHFLLYIQRVTAYYSVGTRGSLRWNRGRIVKLTAQLSAAKVKNWRICTPTVVCLQACTGTNLLLRLGEVVHNIGIQAEGVGASFGS
jgi:hypothetical protein